MRWALLTALLLAAVLGAAFGQLAARAEPLAATREHLERIRAAALAGEWDRAEAEWQGLERSWRQAERIVALFTSHSELFEFGMHLAQLRAAIRTRDPAEAVLAAEAALEVWERIISL